MYFVIIGRQFSLAQYELSSLVPNREIAQHIYLVDSLQDFSRLGGAVKWGRVIPQESLAEELTDVQLVGTADQTLAKYAKRECGVRRYKLLELMHTDLEIVEKGVELVALDAGNVGIVTGYQDIKRFETIDIGKPIRGMEIGMMPAKLTQILVNIGVGQIDNTQDLTIYDPFCGFGTTLFVANSLGYNAIGSDTNLALAKQNIKRRTSTAYATEHKITLFKHDATTVSDKPFLQHVDLVVTEGWLGPVVYENTHRDALQQHMTEIITVYSGCISALQTRLSVPMIMTIPTYTRLSDWPISKTMHQIVQNTGVEFTLVGNYHRTSQLVQREIVLIAPKE